MNFNQVKISNSPTNGKARVIDILNINIDLANERIEIPTQRRFFEIDDSGIDGLGMELTGKVEFPIFYHTMTASNDANHLCNPDNGLSVYVTLSGSTNVWQDVQGNVVENPIGLFDFFKPYLSQPVAIMDMVRQNVSRESLLYKTWDK